jgi:hypothetical protein
VLDLSCLEAAPERAALDLHLLRLTTVLSPDESVQDGSFLKGYWHATRG